MLQYNLCELTYRRSPQPNQLSAYTEVLERMNASVAFNSADSRDKVRPSFNSLACAVYAHVHVGSPRRERCKEAHPALHKARRRRLLGRASRRLGVLFSPFPSASPRHHQTLGRVPPYLASPRNAPLTSCSVRYPVRAQGRAERIWRYARGMGPQMPGDVWEARRRPRRDDRWSQCRRGGRQVDAGPPDRRKRESGIIHLSAARLIVA